MPVLLSSKKIPKWQPRPEILLSDNIPQPMHGVAPREVLGGKWWDIERKTAYASTSYHCVACAAHKTDVRGNRKHLEGHELYNIDYIQGRMVYLETVPLCPWCHSYCHSGRLHALMKKGTIPQAHYVAVIQHGDKVLEDSECGIRPPIQELEQIQALRISFRKFQEWKKWRLVVNDTEYKPKYRSLKQWEKAHG